MTPSFDPRAAAAVERSLELAAERAGDLTGPVYARLFERAPEMRALFWRDVDGAIRGEMLMRVFEAILDFIGERRYSGLLIRSEAETHAGYDVPPEVFASFFGIVAESVEEACAGAWTPAMAGAWDQLLGEVARFAASESVGAAGP